MGRNMCSSMVNVEVTGNGHHNRHHHADSQHSRHDGGHVGVVSQPQVSAWHLAVVR
jgi:hypothetical protein